MKTETITWRPVSEGLPDAESNVLLALADGTTCEGFCDGVWEQFEDKPPLFRDVCAEPIDRDVVTHWSDMPKGPNAC